MSDRIEYPPRTSVIFEAAIVAAINAGQVENVAQLSSAYLAFMTARSLL